MLICDFKTVEIKDEGKQSHPDPASWPLAAVCHLCWSSTRERPISPNSFFHLIVTDSRGSSDREHEQKQERRFRQETVAEGAVGARHNTIKSSSHLLSDQPLELEA